MRPRFKPAVIESLDIVQKTFDFSLSLIEFYIFLIKNNQFDYSERLLKSGTNIRENLEQSLKSNNKQDFISKISLASKDAMETRYWLKEIQMKYIASDACDVCVDQINEIITVLNYVIQRNCESEVKLNIEYLN